MSKRLIDYDPLTSMAVWHDYDEASDSTHIYEVQDIEPIVRENFRTQNHAGGHAMGLNDYSRKGIKEGWWHIARIPNATQLDWRVNHGVNIHLWGKCDWTTKKMKRLLNSREYQYLRAGLGRI
jgi:hypothetical protein